MKTALASIFCAAGVLAATAVSAQAEFAAAPIPKAAELTERLNGHTWHAKLADGTTWRMDFKSSSGYVFMDTSRGQRDTGKWRTEDGRVCIEWHRFPSGCGDWRIAGETVYLKRSTTGEIVFLEKK